MSASPRQKHQVHAGGAQIARRGITATSAFYDAARAPSLPRNWRDRLPDPAAYYPQRIDRLSKPNASGWAQGKCPFHDDHNASLSVQVSDARGGWRCFAACGAGDLIAFHMRQAGLAFRDAVRDLIGRAA